MGEKLLTIEEVARYLNLPGETVKELVEKGELAAYKIGGSFLRFKRDQIEIYRQRAEGQLRVAGHPNVLKAENVKPYTFWERFEDFLYYNDFYILSSILLALIVLAVFEF